MQIKSKSKTTTKYIQSCITSISFPKTINDVLTMVERNKSRGNWLTDMDVLLNFENGVPIFWTAPIWLTEGDVIFFYHTKTAKPRTAKLLKEAQETIPNKKK